MEKSACFNLLFTQQIHDSGGGWGGDVYSFVNASLKYLALIMGCINCKLENDRKDGKG